MKYIENAKNYIEDNGLTIAAFAKTLGVRREYLSEYLNGKARNEDTESAIESALEEFFEIDLKYDGGMLHTDDADGILYVCKLCQDSGGLGMITGKPGSGKTYTLRNYAKNPKVVYIECNDTMNTRDLVKKIRAAFSLPEKYGSINDAIEEICELCEDAPGFLLLIDEADKMLTKFTQKKMEIIRALYDNAQLSIVLAGEPQLEGNIKTYVGRMADRMDWTYRLHGISKDEAARYVSSLNLTDKAREEIISRAIGGKSGSFRRLNRIVRNLKVTYPSEKINDEMVRNVAQMMF